MGGSDGAGNDGQEPLYRLRLFLSVDLVGSTAFKSKEHETNLVWIKAFQKFYEQFPKLFRREYRKFCDGAPEIHEVEKASEPRVWKTIGDEIIFVNRVHSIAHLSAYVTAFREALLGFGEEVSSLHSLDTKGNGWIAAFPTPNRSIRLALDAGDTASSANDDILTEADEAKVDDTPSKFDFLGKGIDGGFRISRNSNVDAMTLSPALAYLLCKARKNVDSTKFDCKLSFHEPEVFKGVMAGRKYPVVCLVTSRNGEHEAIENLEARLLDRPRFADIDTLYEYLERYIEQFKVEKPALKLTYGNVSVPAPEHYQAYIKSWKEDIDQLHNQKIMEVEAASSSGPDDGDADEGNDDSAVDALLLKINESLRQE